MNGDRLIIALSGFKGSGKDTFATYLVEELSRDRPTMRLAFADPIRNTIMHIFELTDTNEYDLFKRTNVELFSTDEQLSSKTIEGRRVLREIGMLMRMYDESQFTKYVKKRIEKFPDSHVVVTDMRFDNELEMLRDVGATLINITGGMHKGDADLHVTERGFSSDTFDHLIKNDGSLRELQTKAHQLIRDLKE
jgi:hypothetical protein